MNPTHDQDHDQDRVHLRVLMGGRSFSKRNGARDNLNHSFLLPGRRCLRMPHFSAWLIQEETGCRVKGKTAMRIVIARIQGEQSLCHRIPVFTFKFNPIPGLRNASPRLLETTVMTRITPLHGSTGPGEFKELLLDLGGSMKFILTGV